MSDPISKQTKSELLEVLRPRYQHVAKQHGHLALDATVRQRVLAVSAATIDRLLGAVRSNTSSRKQRKTATKPDRCRQCSAPCIGCSKRR